MSTGSLVNGLRDGGYVIFLRHTATDLSRTDEDMTNLSDCSVQRNLTDEGRRRALEIGDAFRSAGIPVGEVLASPYCRTRDTAALAFGKANVETSRDLLSPEYVPEDEADTVAGYEGKLRRLLSTRAGPEACGNRVLVGHESVLRGVTGESVAEGGAVIFEPLGGGEYRVEGSIGPDEWIKIEDAGEGAGRAGASSSCRIPLVR